MKGPPFFMKLQFTLRSFSILAWPFQLAVTFCKMLSGTISDSVSFLVLLKLERTYRGEISVSRSQDKALPVVWPVVYLVKKHFMS